MIYLDNSASSKYKPKDAVKALKHGAKHLYANAGRAAHKMAIKSLEAIENTRQTVNDYFSVTGTTIFTSGCTEALNLAIIGTAKPGGHVITTALEHNSTLRPLTMLVNSGLITLTILQPNGYGVIQLDKIKSSINSKTYLIAINHTSNVTGATQNINQIGNLCKQKNIMLLVDSAQSAGHIDINMKRDNISMLAFAGHKGLHGFAGIGGLCIAKDVNLNVVKYGGTGTASHSLVQPSSPPENFEAGTQSALLINSLNHSIKWTQKNQNKITSKTRKLSKLVLKKFSTNSKIKLYTKNTNGVISFNIIGTDSTILGDYLASKGICTRSGLHCAPLYHKNLGTIQQGTVRASIGYNNTKWQINKFIKIVEKFK